MLLYVNKLYYFICRYNDKLINYVGFFTLHEIAIFIIVMKCNYSGVLKAQES